MSANTVPLDREMLRHSAQGLEPAVVPVRESGPMRELRPVPRTRARGRSPLFAAFTSVAIILTVLAAQLGLSIAVSDGAYEARALQTELRDLTRVERVLSQNTDKLASPQNLADNAARLGMVQNTTPATLRLSDGVVLGNLVGATSTISTSLVPNSALNGLPMVDADGLLVERNVGLAEAAALVAQRAPIAWEGALPAPQTH